MRIAYFTDTYLPEVNGVATSLEAHTRMLADRGHDIVIMCPKYRVQVPYAVPGIHIRRYNAFSFFTNKATRIAAPSIPSVATTLRRFKPDVVHIHTPLSVGVVGLVTAKMLRVPNVQTYHTFIPDFMQYVELHRLLRLDDLQDRVVNAVIFERMFQSNLWQRLSGAGRRSAEVMREIAGIAEPGLEEMSDDERVEMSTRIAWQFSRTLYNRANLVLTPSVTLKHELERNGIVRPVEYLSNGIDRSLIAPKETYASTGRILHAGRLGHEKNVDVVVKAVARLLERRPVVLDIVGDGPARENVERLAERLGIAHAVRFRGFMDRAQLGRIYRDYDAFVTASTIETQGIVLLEAMSAGLPVVGVDALAVPELIRDGRDGIIVKPGDDAAMADALEVLLGDEDARRRMGNAAREDVVPHSLDKVVSRLESIYVAVSAERPAED